jgi:hypothetical protein
VEEETKRKIGSRERGNKQKEKVPTDRKMRSEGMRREGS